MEIWKAAAEDLSLKQKHAKAETIQRSCGLCCLFWLRDMGDATEAGRLTERLECQVFSRHHS